jgi:hypothetical protein
LAYADHAPAESTDTPDIVQVVEYFVFGFLFTGVPEVRKIPGLATLLCMTLPRAAQ